MLCRLTITLPYDVGEPDVEMSYEDVGETSSAFDNTVKALYSDARKRAGVAAGIGAYLYTAMPEIVLPLNSSDIRMLPGGDAVVSVACQARLRREYQAHVLRSEVIGTFGQVFAHGEPDGGIGVSDDDSAAEKGTEAQEALPATQTEAGTVGRLGPEPPSAPVALVGEQSSGQRQAPASRAVTTLSDEQQQRICELAEAHGLTRGDVANVVRTVSGHPAADSETAAREFDGGLLATTPAHHMPRIVDAIVHAGGDRQLALAGTNGHVPIDYRDL
ncbi:hypothetical protein [Conexibacter sp. CPCC 206217]|uniref:hypothetical protein n=1 Tax=Conexibacter sp. CPCC 206217 TaxID=3064574 RepID=UPI00271F6117|nr:hypothetical protein [Conexibacter sp. CPCC 206217]MDO8208967.1 hypothetical protein [Conexibacter sp. CPCC 206217]